MIPSRGIRIGILAVLVACLGPPALAQPTKAQEHQLKAAYLCRFAEFITWPSTAPTGRMVIGIVDFEPYRETVQSPAEDGAHDGRFEFVDIDTPEQARGCHILFINTTDRSELTHYLDAIAPAPVLVVTDVRTGARMGAAISFFTIDGKIRFAINEDAANKAGLAISSRLLRLGRVVKSGPTEGDNHEAD